MAKELDFSIFGIENKEKYLIYVLKNTFERHVDLLLIGEEGKRHHVQRFEYINVGSYITPRKKIGFTGF